MARKTKRPQSKPEQREVRFSFVAPDAREVTVVGDFNQWDQKVHVLKKRSDGQWEKTVSLPPGSYEYKFMVDGQWRMDPENDWDCRNEFGTKNNIVVIASE